MEPSSQHAAVGQAAKLLGADRSRHKVEGNVQSDVEALLRAMNLGTLESQYQTGDGPVDIYLPNRRTLIEVKAYPLGKEPDRVQPGRDESALDQLHRYVHAEANQERILEPTLGDSLWTGIITDGRNWHIYEFSNEIERLPQLRDAIAFINEAEALVKMLFDALGTDMIGREWIPAQPRELFSDFKNELDRLFFEVPRRAMNAKETKYQLWLDMMKASGMVPPDEEGRRRLFLAHSFLIVTVRLVSYSMLNHNKLYWESALRDGFAAWVLDFQRGMDWAERLYQCITEYDWRRRRSDVLRDLYHEYVEEADRKLFGEFYTPDWLAELMVREVIDDTWIENSVDAVIEERVNGIGVLDPACGSGTFLYHAALRLASSEYLRAFQPVKRADVICRLLNGIDIHPVAVEISKVNIERALPTPPSDGTSALQVYLGDSLQIHRRDDLFTKSGLMRLVSPKGRPVEIPMAFVRNPAFSEYLRQMVNAASERKDIPRNTPRGVNRDGLRNCYKQLVDIIEEEGDSVWTWYCANLAGPNLLTERKVDRLVANPPWVKLADIQVESRKRDMEQLGEALGLQAGGKYSPHLDIASFFVLRARQLYLQEPESNSGAWIVKVSALRAGQWRLFRELHSKSLSQSVDLTAIRPFGGGDATRCCVLLEHCKLTNTPWTRVLAKRVANKVPATNESLASAERKLVLERAPNPIPQAPSIYLDAGFRQGATIVPHVLCWVEGKSRVDGRGFVTIETKTSSKNPWSKVERQRGKVPAEWIRSIHTSNTMFAYTVSQKLSEVIIPIEKGSIHVNPTKRSRFWHQLDEIYEVHRGRGRGTPKTLITLINNHNTISDQLSVKSRKRRMVLYCRSGDHMRAARVSAGKEIVDNGLYWLIVESEDEAGYLVTLLNAACLDRAFSESRESGRDFHLHPWRKVPIPLFDQYDQDHIRLAELCNAAEDLANIVVREALTDRPSLGQVGVSKRIRDAIGASKIGQEINEISRRLLPSQARK